MLTCRILFPLKHRKNNLNQVLWFKSEVSVLCIEFPCIFMQYFKYECKYQIKKAANGIRFYGGLTVFLLR